MDIVYLGDAERVDYSSQIAAHGVPRVICDWSLLERNQTFSVGTARNTALMATVDESFLMFDDDVRLKAYVSAGTSTTLDLCGHDRRRILEFCTTREEALARVEVCAQASMVESINKMLGRGLHDIVGTWIGDVQMEQACPHQISSLMQTNGCVPIVQLGIIGDSAMHTGDWIGMMGETARRQITASDRVHNNALLSREVVNISSSFAITHEPSCMALAVALDNAYPMPPFMPHYRNEDGIFACLVAACCPDSNFGHIPVGVLHDAERPRRYSDGTVLRISDFVIQAISEISPLLGSNTTSNYALVGQYLRNVSACDLKSFVAVIRKWAMMAYTVRLSFIETALEKNSKQSEWKVHLERLRTQIQTTIRDGFWYIPIELLDCKNEDRCVIAFKYFICRLGETLIYWMEMREIAKELWKARGTVG